MLDVKHLKFTVEDDQRVFLHLGPVGINVCDTPEDFGWFVEELVRHLNTIGDEIKSDYCQ